MQDLLRVWIDLQFQEDDFVHYIWQVAKLSNSTEHMLLIIDAVRDQVSFVFDIHVVSGHLRHIFVVFRSKLTNSDVMR